MSSHLNIFLKAHLQDRTETGTRCICSRNIFPILQGHALEHETTEGSHFFRAPQAESKPLVHVVYFDVEDRQG